MLLDTSPLIYLFEGHPEYEPRVKRWFELAVHLNVTVITTPITVAECTVGAPSPELQQEYAGVLLGGEGIILFEIGAQAARTAAKYRREYGLRLLDAFQAAATVGSGCWAILTNDAVFKRIPDFQTILVSDLEV